MCVCVVNCDYFISGLVGAGIGKGLSVHAWLNILKKLKKKKKILFLTVSER